jgi:hypothetical protein
VFGCHAQALFRKFPKDEDHIPISVNSAENGLFACKLCHSLFDHKAKHITIDGTGLLHFTAFALKEKKFKELHDAQAKVTFAANIGSPNYPSAIFLEWAAKQARGVIAGRKRARDSEDSPDSEDSCPSVTAAKRAKAAAPSSSISDRFELDPSQEHEPPAAAARKLKGPPKTKGQKQ